MTTPKTPSEFPNEEGVRYERVDSLTVNVYIDGPGDTTVRPPTPSRLKELERDRELIAEMNARVRRDQEKLKGRSNAPSNPDEPDPV